MHGVQAGQPRANYVPEMAWGRAKESGDNAAPKERLSLLWLFVLLNHLYADVIALRVLLGSSPADTPHLGQLALAGWAVLMEIPIAIASFSGEPAGEYHRRQHRDPGQRCSDLHSTSGRVGPAARFAGVLVLRNARNGLHRVHRLEGVDVVTG